MFDTSEVSTDQLEALLVAHERVIARHRAAQLETLRILDQRQVAAADGCHTMVEWATGRLDVDTPTAQGLVTAGRALRAGDPLLEALAGGECSFDRALATSLLAQTGVDEHTVGLSAGLDVPGVRRLAARWKHRPTRQYRDAYDARHLVIQPGLHDATWRLWGTLPGYEGRIVEKALNQRTDELPDNPPVSRAARRADALVMICADSLTADRIGGEPTLVVHLHTSESGRAALSLNNGLPLGKDTLERLLCTAKLDRQTVAVDGTPLGVGRVTRAIPRAWPATSSAATRPALLKDAPAATGSKPTTSPPGAEAAPPTPTTSPPSAGTTTTPSSTAKATKSTPPAHPADSASPHPHRASRNKRRESSNNPAPRQPEPQGPRPTGASVLPTTSRTDCRARGTRKTAPGAGRAQPRTAGTRTTHHPGETATRR